VRLARTDLPASITVCLRFSCRHKVPRISEFMATKPNFPNLERLARHLQFKWEYQCAHKEKN